MIPPKQKSVKLSKRNSPQAQRIGEALATRLVEALEQRPPFDGEAARQLQALTQREKEANRKVEAKERQLLQYKLRQCQQHCEKLQDKLLRRKEQTRQLREQLSQLRSTRPAQTQSIRESVREEYVARLKGLQCDLDRARSDHKHTKNLAAELNSRNRELQLMNEQLVSRVGCLEQKKEALAAELDCKEDRLRALQTELAQVKLEHCDSLKEWKLRSDGFEIASRAAQGRAQQCQKRLEESKALAEGQRGQIEVLTNELNCVAGENYRLVEHCQRCQSALKLREEEFEGWRSKLSSLLGESQGRVKALKEEVEGLAAENSRLKVQNRSMELVDQVQSLKCGPRQGGEGQSLLAQIREMLARERRVQRWDMGEDQDD